MAENEAASTGAIVVTGASSGIGEACALYLAQLGFQVFVGVRKTADGEALKQKSNVSGRLVLLLLDVTRADMIASAVDVVSGAVGERGLAGLVNNAGISVAAPLEFLPIDELRKQFEVNVVGQIAVTQAFLPLLRMARGRIVNIGSIAGRLSTPFLGPYSASKYAMEALTDSLRSELAPWGLMVSLIEPGSIATPIWEKGLTAADELVSRFPPQALEHYSGAISAMRRVSAAMGRRGIPAERVAQAVAHALTASRPKTRYVVGRDAWLRLIISLLPDRLRDRMVLRAMGLPRKPEQGSGQVLHQP